MSKIFFNKNILITGICGTVGKELLRQVLDEKPNKVIGLDNNETGLFFIAEKHRLYHNTDFFFADIRDKDSLTQHMNGIDIVFHTAAMKHVIISERSPRDSIRSNVIGVQNVIDASLLQGVKRVIFTSSDKAVNPTNVMGTTKLMGERLMTAASAFSPLGGTIFATTRFGNVLGSRGSVIPIFKDQIAQGGPITITDDSMTRFIMSLEQSVRLVLDSVVLSKGGEVFVTKMPVIKIKDLAKVMIEEMAPQFGYDPKDISLETIGAKPGEKLYEELINEEETRRCIELEKYFVITPAFKSIYEHIIYEYPRTISSPIGRQYNSAQEEALTKGDLRKFLRKNNLI